MPRTSTKAAGFRLDDQIGFLLRRAYQRASANLNEGLAAHDLTAPHFATLARLHEHGQLSQNLLGRLVAMEPANISELVRRLKKRRLVAADRDPQDARLTRLSLTAAGRALVQRILPIQQDCAAMTLAPL